jgi:hypothetical protein
MSNSPTDRHRRCWFVSASIAIVSVIGLSVVRPSFADEGSDPDSDPKFSLQQGQGVPVCDAYLQLLNQTKFDVTPFCRRPDEGSVKGFEHLERHYLDLEEIWSLYTYVWEFMRFNDQHHVEKFFHPNVDRNKSYWSADATTREVIAYDLRLGRSYVWTYAAPLDIANNGSALNVIIWQGGAATGTGAQCGSDYSVHPWTDSYIHTRAFVLTADGKAIDEDQTRLIFGAPAGRAHESMTRQLPGANLPAGAKPFRPLADSIAIFKYAGRYYMETEDQPDSKDAELPPVQVFLRENGSTRKVCTLRPESVPVPLD